MTAAETAGNEGLGQLAQTLARVLLERGLRAGTAESCTGGWVAKCLTDIAGSSAWFECGLVTYSNRAKEELLGVPRSILAQHGAVSAETARAMVTGLCRQPGVDVGVAVTGIAGPGGGSADKPVGRVWLAWAGPGGEARVESMQFDGDRNAIREASVRAALRGLIAAAGGDR